MLIEFRVQNHRSIRDEQVLSLEAATHEATDDRPRARTDQGKPLLPAVALYGANASGKSNVLGALGFMQSAVAQSHRSWEPEEGVPRDPFAWGSQDRESSLFEVTFLVGAVRYQYGFVADDERFTEEWLFAYPQGRKQTWFERDGDNFKFGEHLPGENRVVEEVTRPNALFLSTAAQHHHKKLTAVYRWFRELAVVNVARSRRETRHPPPEFWISRLLARRPDTGQMSLLLDASDGESDGLLASFLNLLRAADVGIVDLKLVDDAGSHSPRHRRSRILVGHQVSDGDAWLPLEEESHGTQTLFTLAYPVLQALRHGGLLVIDELESSLHPLLAAHLVRRFNDPSTNPRNAQIIFTTHDTNLLGTTLGDPLLRRDQVWLTEKDQDGATCLYPLSDYKPRKGENLERGYLQGRYGAIPFLGGLGLPQG
ncbi:MAG: ATP-binding protein [Nannocystaceae bacterium]